MISERLSKRAFYLSFSFLDPYAEQSILVGWRLKFELQIRGFGSKSWFNLSMLSTITGVTCILAIDLLCLATEGLQE